MDTTAPSFQSMKDFSLEGRSETFVKWCRPWWIWVQGLPSQPWALEQISFMVYFCWLGSYTLFDSNRRVDWHTSRSSPKLSRKKPRREKNEESETEELWSLSNPFSNKHWLFSLATSECQCRLLSLEIITYHIYKQYALSRVNTGDLGPTEDMHIYMCGHNPLVYISTEHLLKIVLS